jgi:hypothetical protein
MPVHCLGEEAGTSSRRRAEISPSKKRKRERERCTGPENGVGATVDGMRRVETGNRGGDGQRHERGSNRRLAGEMESPGSNSAGLCKKD